MMKHTLGPRSTFAHREMGDNGAKYTRFLSFSKDVRGRWGAGTEGMGRSGEEPYCCQPYLGGKHLLSDGIWRWMSFWKNIQRFSLPRWTHEISRDELGLFLVSRLEEPRDDIWRWGHCKGRDCVGRMMISLLNEQMTLCRIKIYLFSLSARWRGKGRRK